MDDLEIIKYLDGEMSAEERRRFEEALSMNPELAEELEKYRKMQEIAKDLLAGPDPETEEEIRESVRDFKSDAAAGEQIPKDYREILMDAEREMHRGPSPGSVRAPIRRIWAAAAALVMIALSIYVLIDRPFREISDDEFYQQYFQPLDLKGDIADLARTDNDFLFAVEVYEARDYERAAVLFEMLLDRPGLGPWAILYASSSYMFIYQTDPAIELLEGIGADQPEGIAERAGWLLGLAYLKEGDTEKAKAIFRELSAGSLFRKESRKILRILE